MGQKLLKRDDAELVVYEGGKGPPVVFQHGLGGDEAQVAQNVPASAGIHRLTLECRGHGASSLGNARPFSIRMFAEDVLAAATEYGFNRFIVGGISMGAAIALHLAHHHAHRVAGLVLVRPAWTFEASPDNLEPIRAVAALIRSYPIEEARSRFIVSETGQRIATEAPDNFSSLLGYFDRPDALAFASVLADIAADGPDVPQAAAAPLAVPTLIIGNRHDAIHPLSCAQTLADVIPGASFVEVTAKAIDKDRHFAEVQDAIAHFLASKTIRSFVPS
ncbi:MULTISPECIES: alpha/beta fold hydrolase [Rhizobium]|uniref:Alpha/beta hydrolase n=1 Tax=Rhizobium tropici TaxID=398 RepID=A0A6P1C7B7_RHITR|nr:MULTISPECIES: alpha/beta hydrolase [Rhizobium]AGB74183.1 putative hydrolase, alpha/beta fold family [Rhizobium tropici CIAT 899]MBB4240668.1 pimeloyl-ACP methyl ester carboxylesterase [Rhizobium tropici]MBB5591915.1 pimeloyl-ACP methyl ester carboxylesterase [Rhizobium tropici]MBB6490969.1 pimeloyl-ACP methyl ester carboxylesterase [Rhizobium tropici]NEV12627.1 alpha/beta hydrolase [Rhizobium tropici]